MKFVSRTVVPFRKGVAVLVLSTSVLAFAGCAPSGEASETQNSSENAQDLTLPEVSIDGFGDVKAELDTVNGIATTPMTEFLPGIESNYGRTATHASEVLIARCLTGEGIDYPVAAQSDWENVIPSEDRMFGQWDVTDAEQFGVEMDPIRGIASVSFAGEPSQASSDGLKSCGEEVRLRPEFQLFDADESGQSIADRIAENSALKAEDSSAGQAATKKYVQCLTEHNVSLDEGTGELSGSDSPVKSARCNVDSGRIQTMYDVKARYESAYAKKYKKELADLKLRMEENTVALQAIIDGDA